MCLKYRFYLLKYLFCLVYILSYTNKSCMSKIPLDLIVFFSLTEKVLLIIIFVTKILLLVSLMSISYYLTKIIISKHFKKYNANFFKSLFLLFTSLIILSYYFNILM